MYTRANIARMAQSGRGNRIGSRLGDSASLWAGLTRSLNPFVFLPADYNYLTSPGSPDPAASGSDFFSNMFYGNLTQSQVDTIKQTVAQNITKASNGNAALAQQQIAMANQTIDKNVSSWGGIAPSITDLTKPISDNDLVNSIIPNGSSLLWLVGIAAFGAYLVYKR